jgi:hypothetical protein
MQCGDQTYAISLVAMENNLIILIKVVELLSVKYGLVYTNYDIFNHLTGIT